MPTYEYLCDACGHDYEIVQKMSEDSLKTCPVCGKDKLHRVINATAFHLKGSGWYKTDYASSGSSTGSSTSSSSGTSSGVGDTSTSPTSKDDKTSGEASSIVATSSTSSGSDTTSTK